MRPLAISSNINDRSGYTAKMEKIEMNVGTVIHGTLRPEDLVPAFIEELGRFDPIAAEYWGSRAIDIEAVNELIDELNEHAHGYCYFGTHEGDGSDFGWWIDWSAIDEAKAAGDLTIVEDPSQLAAPSTQTPEAMFINDHGNVTFYRWDGSDWVEVWSVV